MAKIGEVLSKIKEVFIGHKLSPAEKVFAEIGGSRRNVKNILSGGVAEDERIAKEQQTKRDAFVKGLVYVEGDQSKGFNKSIQLTERDLAKMKELNMHYRYQNDTAFGNLMIEGDEVDFKFPDGKPGKIYIKYSAEKGTMDYGIEKRCNRGEDRVAA